MEFFLEIRNINEKIYFPIKTRKIIKAKNKNEFGGFFAMSHLFFVNVFWQY